MAEITISELPAKTSLLDSDLIVIDDGTQSYRVTGAQLREFLKVNFLSVGTVVWSQSALATDNPGRLPLWTGEYIASASTIYPDFYSWVKNKHPELCKTKEQYDLLAATEAGCPFFVVDEEEGSLRLPKLKAFIKNAGEDGITQGDAGLPNITGTLGSNIFGGATGAFTYNNTARGDSGGSNTEQGTATLDASLSSEVYGKSDTVTPAHTTLYPWVCAYNAAIPASVAQTAEFQEGLSGKADANLGNIPTNYDYVVERYNDENRNWYEVWKSGWLRQGGKLSSGQITSVTLLKPFANGAYTVISVAEAQSGRNYFAYNKTTTSFSCAQGFSNSNTIANHWDGQNEWIAEGKGA